MLSTVWEDLDPGARTALEEAFIAWRAGGLPCGSAIVDVSGAVLARGRNHAYDPPTGSDILEGTPLAHAEMNAIARLDTARDLSNDLLWSTQQPCAMCSAAIEFCGLGSTRYLAADPAFLAGDDPRAGVVADPTVKHPELTSWALLANALFLQAAISRGNHERIERNESHEPETVALARQIAAAPDPPDLPALFAHLPDLDELATRRLDRLRRPTR
ncbi:MAG TPA: deaminase [Acidimicrobiia bacterium]